MEFQYENTHADWIASFDNVWGKDRKSRQRTYYQDVVWYVAVLALGSYVAIKGDEFFILCVFVALAGFYLKQNWSFERVWKAQAARYAEFIPECTCHLRVDDAGLTESFSGLVTQVEWAQIHDYTLTTEHLFIHFLKYRAFVIPLRYVTPEQRDELIKQLETRGKKPKV